MIADNLITGLRMGAIVVFAWLALRLLLDSWRVTEQARGLRVHAWVYFRASIAVICFSMIFLAAPENILRAEGVIGDRTGFWLMASIALGIMVWAVIIHRALDIATQRRGSTGACAGIAAVSLCYAIGKAAQWTT